MGAKTSIEWCDHTFNPWWGCVKVSPGCANCYAETFSKRLGQKVWGEDAPRRFFGDKHWNEPLKWNAKAAKTGDRPRVFCGSMCDWLEDRENLTPQLARLLTLIRATPNLDWLLLTKRPENFMARCKDVYSLTHCHSFAAWLHGWAFGRKIPRNVWVGTTVENQEYADKRIPELLKIPAEVRFLSCEPLLGGIDVSDFIYEFGCRPHCGVCSEDADCPMNRVTGRWVICGGESGPWARPMHPNWARSLRDQCLSAGVPFFFKQWGEWITRDGGPGFYRLGKQAAGRLLDGAEHNEFPNQL